MKNPAIAQIIRDDQWSVAEGDAEGSPVLIRFREQLLTVSDTTGYEQLLTILWPYADEGNGVLPTPEANSALEKFEERLCAAFEHDARAIVAAVVTTDGARQWIVYTDDINECGERLSNMPQNDEPYPIEMQADEDPQWSLLHEVATSNSNGNT